MRIIFKELLEKLNIELITMGALCEEAITCAVKALLDNDNQMAEKAFAAEKEIDGKERLIESLCMKLFISQQPVAGDLRVVSSALKMIGDMERIGDQASDIAEITKHVSGNNTFGRTHIKEMAEAAIKMVTDSINSFVKNDLNAAKCVIIEDDTVDSLFVKVKEELISIIAEDPKEGEYCIDILMIAKYLERIGDHATNIAEWVEYSITGTHKEGKGND